MGKGILFIVSFILAGAGYLLFGGQRAAVETTEAQGDYQYQVVARDIALSGFERGVSAIKRDLMDVNTDFDRFAMAGGHYDLQIHPNGYGDFDVTVAANVGNATHEIEGKVIFTAPLPGTVLLEDEEVAVTGYGPYQISGVDVRAPSEGDGGGYGDSVPGVLTTASHRDAVYTSFGDNHVVGASMDPDYQVDAGSVQGTFDEAEAEALYQEAQGKATRTIGAAIPIEDKVTLLRAALNNASASDPEIVRVQGDLYLTQDWVTSPLTGYGMLIVEDGDLYVDTENFQWEGLVMVRKTTDDTARVALRNGASISGGLIAYDVDPLVGTEQTECVPDFDVQGNETVVHEDFTVQIEVLGAAISNGGLYDMPVTAQIEIGDDVFEPWGDYDKPLDGNLNQQGQRFVFEPDQVFPAGTSIRINSRSWVRKLLRNGSQNGHWKIFMEKNSLTYDSQLAVLVDGASVPSVGGFLGQFSVADFVSDFIFGNTINLEENQSIYLFELGVSNPASLAHDMQDLVVVVTLTAASNEQGTCQAVASASRLEFSMGNGSTITYSTEAIAKLGKYLDIVRNQTRVAVASTLVKGAGKDEHIRFASSIAADDQEGRDTIEDGDETMSVCVDGVAKTIAKKRLGTYISYGAYAGACP